MKKERMRGKENEFMDESISGPETAERQRRASPCVAPLFSALCKVNGYRRPKAFSIFITFQCFSHTFCSLCLS